MKNLLTFIYGTLLIIFGSVWLKDNVIMITWPTCWRVIPIFFSIVMIAYGFEKVERCTY